MVLEYLKLDLGPCRKLLPAKIPDSRHFKGQDRTYPNFKKNKKNICRKTSIKTENSHDQKKDTATCSFALLILSLFQASL